ncbi:MAG: aromatic amino acid lyase [Terracidiphilus sp.]
MWVKLLHRKQGVFTGGGRWGAVFPFASGFDFRQFAVAESLYSIIMLQWMVIICNRSCFLCRSVHGINLSLAHPASVDSVPTSGGKEDHVSMGMTAALKAGRGRPDLRR